MKHFISIIAMMVTFQMASASDFGRQEFFSDDSESADVIVEIQGLDQLNEEEVEEIATFLGSFDVELILASSRLGSGSDRYSGYVCSARSSTGRSYQRAARTRREARARALRKCQSATGVSCRIQLCRTQ